MSTLNPRMRSLAGVAAAGLLAVLQAACADAPQVTAPDPAQDATAERVGPSATYAVATCEVAIHTVSGWRTRTVPVRLPASIRHPGLRTAKYGYRGWTPGEADPGSLMLCDLPATAAAGEWFRSTFVRGRSGSTDTRADGPVFSTASTATPETFTTEPAEVYDGPAMVACEPYAVQSGDEADVGQSVSEDCGCTTPDCSGWEEGGEWEGPAPTDPEPVEGSIEGDGSGAAAPSPAPDGSGEYLIVAASCYGQTDLPHRSTHVPGSVNVVARTTCNFPTAMTVSTSLQRQKCLWIFCWWSSLSSGYYAGTGLSISTNAAAFCQKGWWRGSSSHTAVFPTGGTGYAWTANANYISFC
jgi:hypothetical protein